MKPPQVDEAEVDQVEAFLGTLSGPVNAEPRRRVDPVKTPAAGSAGGL